MCTLTIHGKVWWLTIIHLKIKCFSTTYTDEKRKEINETVIPKHAESRARYPRDTSHVICLPHIRQNLTALITRLCEKLQSHPRGCFGVGHPRRLDAKVTMKETCRVPASLALWPLREIPSKPATSAKMTGVGSKCYTEGWIKVDTLREIPGKPLISVIHVFPTPVILADVPGLNEYPPKGHDARLAGTRHASFMVRLLLNLFGWPTPKQPHRWLCKFSQSLFISAGRFCLICGKHITCEVSRSYRARDSACFVLNFLYYWVRIVISWVCTIIF